jgi:hypothetical protein
MANIRVCLVKQKAQVWWDTFPIVKVADMILQACGPFPEGHGAAPRHDRQAAGSNKIVYPCILFFMRE